MARLPTIGADEDEWGDLLVGYLLVSHNSDGTLREATSTQRVEVAKNGALIGARKRVNLLEGAGVALTVADNAAGGSVDVTITASGGGGGPSSGIPTSIVDAQGDQIVGTGPDTVVRVPIGTAGQIWTADPTAAAGASWKTPTGGGAATSARANLLYVAAADAPAGERARADYLCDGVGDQVEIQAAVTAARSSGARVLLSPGGFNLSAPVELTGPNTVQSADQLDQYLEGAGPRRTRLIAASGIACALRISQVARVHVHNLGFQISGASHGIQSVATNTETAGWRSFWLSSFINLEFLGDWVTHTGWAMHLESPFRSVFVNIDGNGIANGIRMFATADDFNPGDFTFDRCFLDLFGNNRRALSIESTVPAGNMNQAEIRMFEAIASGTGCVGVYLGGTGPVNHIIMTGVNLEQFDWGYWVGNGIGNEIEGNYWELRHGATGVNGSLLRFDTNAKGTRIRRIGFWYTTNAHRLITSTATSTQHPNAVERVYIYADTDTELGTTANITNQIATAAAVLRKWIVAEGVGVASGVTVAPAV